MAKHCMQNKAGNRKKLLIRLMGNTAQWCGNSRKINRKKKTFSKKSYKMILGVELKNVVLDGFALIQGLCL